jgi:hypothetical protein
VAALQRPHPGRAADFGAQLVGPRAGGVDDDSGADLRLPVLHIVAHADAAHAIAVAQQRGYWRVVERPPTASDPPRSSRSTRRGVVGVRLAIAQPPISPSGMTAGRQKGKSGPVRLCRERRPGDGVVRRQQGPEAEPLLALPS